MRSMNSAASGPRMSRPPSVETSIIPTFSRTARTSASIGVRARLRRRNRPAAATAPPAIMLRAELDVAMVHGGVAHRLEGAAGEMGELLRHEGRADVVVPTASIDLPVGVGDEPDRVEVGVPALARPHADRRVALDAARCRHSRPATVLRMSATFRSSSKSTKSLPFGCGKIGQGWADERRLGIARHLAGVLARRRPAPERRRRRLSSRLAPLRRRPRPPTIRRRPSRSADAGRHAARPVHRDRLRRRRPWRPRGWRG